jgi:hypothetical protein
LRPSFQLGESDDPLFNPLPQLILAAMSAKDIDPRFDSILSPTLHFHDSLRQICRFEFNAPKFHDFTVDDAPDSPGAFFMDGMLPHKPSLSTQNHVLCYLFIRNALF